MPQPNKTEFPRVTSDAIKRRNERGTEIPLFIFLVAFHYLQLGDKLVISFNADGCASCFSMIYFNRSDFTINSPRYSYRKKLRSLLR